MHVRVHVQQEKLKHAAAAAITSFNTRYLCGAAEKLTRKSAKKTTEEKTVLILENIHGIVGVEGTSGGQLQANPVSKFRNKIQARGM